MSNTMYWETDTRETRMVSGMQGNSNIFTLELIDQSSVSCDV